MNRIFPVSADQVRFIRQRETGVKLLKDRISYPHDTYHIEARIPASIQSAIWFLNNSPVLISIDGILVKMYEVGYENGEIRAVSYDSFPWEG